MTTIKKISTYLLGQDQIFVKIDTSEPGLFGWGSAAFAGHHQPVGAAAGPRVGVRLAAHQGEGTTQAHHQQGWGQGGIQPRSAGQGAAIR